MSNYLYEVKASKTFKEIELTNLYMEYPKKKHAESNIKLGQKLLKWVFTYGQFTSRY